jgi:hypothetical protein
MEDNMDYGKILARAFEITYKYRALWLFGFLMALFGGTSGGNNFSYNFGSNGSRTTNNASGAFPTLPSNFWQNFALLIGLVVCIFLILIVLGIIVRFISRGALIGLVEELETTGTKPTIRRGFSIGANRFWQLFGIGLVINLPLVLFSLVVILVAIAPILVTVLPALARNPRSTDFAPTFVGGIFGSIAMICCAVLCLMVVTLVIRPFYEFIVRVCVIDKRGVFDSIREGYRIVRANLGNVVLLYVLLIGVGIAFGILMIPVALFLIGIPVGAAFVVGIASNSLLPAILAGLVIGIPFLLILIFISGLYQVFDSTVWTEGYLAIGKPAVSQPPTA